MTGAATGWSAALDALEARLRAQEAALDGRGPYPPDAALPVVTAGEPLPPDVYLRAVTLLARTRDLEARAGTELARRRARRQAGQA